MTKDGQDAQEPLADAEQEAAYDPDAIEPELSSGEEYKENVEEEQPIERKDREKVSAASQREEAVEAELSSPEGPSEQSQEAETTADAEVIPAVPDNPPQATGKEESPEAIETSGKKAEATGGGSQPGDSNANIEIPAISKDLVRTQKEAASTEPVRPSSGDDQEANSPTIQERTANSTDREGRSTPQEQPEQKLEKQSEIPALIPHNIGKIKQNGARSENREDPHGVQEVLNALPLWYEDSQLLPASYPTTTAYRAAIKKKRYTTVGNTIFLVLCAFALLGITAASFIYFAHNIASSGPGSSAPTSISKQAPLPGTNSINLVGAEASAPKSSGSIVSGYQWIHDETKHELYIDANEHIQELATGNEQTWQITDLTRRSGAAVPNGHALAGFEWQYGNTAQVVYIDAKQHVQQLYSSGSGQWDVMDLTRKALAPLANGSAIAGYEWTQGETKQVTYIDQRGHIQELATSDDNTWRISDLTALTKAPPSNGQVISGYQWSRQGSKQVDYIDTNQHLQDLTFIGGSWHVSDLNTLVGAPLANGKTLTSYEWQQTGARQLAYLDTNNHLQLLSSGSMNNWSLVDLTRLINAPVANGNTLAGYEWQQGGRNVLYFIDGNDHIQELSDAPGENWQVTDLNQVVQGAPLANGNVVSGYDWAQHGSKQVVYIDKTNAVQELTSSNVPGKWELSSWKRS